MLLWQTLQLSCNKQTVLQLSCNKSTVYEKLDSYFMNDMMRSDTKREGNELKEKKWQRTSLSERSRKEENWDNELTWTRASERSNRRASSSLVKTSGYWDFSKALSSWCNWKVVKVVRDRLTLRDLLRASLLLPSSPDLLSSPSSPSTSSVSSSSLGLGQQSSSRSDRVWLNIVPFGPCPWSSSL